MDLEQIRVGTAKSTPMKFLVKILLRPVFTLIRVVWSEKLKICQIRELMAKTVKKLESSRSHP